MARTVVVTYVVVTVSIVMIVSSVIVFVAVLLNRSGCCQRWSACLARTRRGDRRSSSASYESYTIHGATNPLSQPHTPEPHLQESVRVLPSGQVVRRVPVLQALADEKQTWRTINVAVLAGDELRLLSAAPPSPSQRSFASSETGSDTTAVHFQWSPRARSTEDEAAFGDVHGVQDDDDREAEQTSTAQRAGRSSFRVRACEDGTAGQSAPRLSRSLPSTEATRGEAVAASPPATTAASPPPSAVWCALGTPQRTAYGLGGDAADPSANLGGSRDSLSTPPEQGMPMGAPSTREAFPWFPYRHQTRALLVFADGHTEVHTRIEPWDAVQARHRQRDADLQSQSHHAPHLASDSLDGSSRSTSSFLTRLFSRHARQHAEGTSSVSPHTPALPPPLSPVEFAPSPGPFVNNPSEEVQRSATQSTVRGPFGVNPPTGGSVTAASPVNVIAPATVLELEPLRPPPSPTRVALLPSAVRVYGRGYAYISSPETCPLP